MAGFLRSPSVSLQSGSKEIQVTGGVNCSFVVSGTAVYLNDMILLEGVSGTNTDLSGNSTITLRDTYLGDTITGATLTAFNTIEGLRDAIQRARSLAARLDESTTFFGQIITATTPTIEVDINGVPTEVTPYGYLSQQVTELIALADGAADTLIELQGDVALLSATVDSIQSELDAKVLSAQNSANAAAASETVVITAESVVTTARDTVLLARDETVSAKGFIKKPLF